MRRVSGTAAAARGTGAFLALALVLAACASDGGSAPLRPEFDLRHPDAGRRTDAVQEVVRLRDLRYVPDLIEMLDDRDETVRLVAGSALRDLTGRESGYRAFAPAEERRAQVLDWRHWYATRNGVAASSSDGTAP